jgi:chromate transport protein ChrA
MIRGGLVGGVMGALAALAGISLPAAILLAFCAGLLVAMGSPP